MLTRAPMTAQPPSETSSPAPAPARPAGITPVLLLILDGFGYREGGDDNAVFLRQLGVPVIKCFTSYESLRDVPPWKVDAMYRDFFHGMPTTEPDPRLHDPDYDYTFSKTAASIFFQTPLTAYLARLRVDTVIVTGCTTSGCVRASVVDAFSHGLRPIIPEDCAGDGSEEAHRRNLHDMSLRYADVTDSDAVMAWLRGLKA